MRALIKGLAVLVLFATVLTPSPGFAQPPAATNFVTAETESVNFSWAPAAGATWYYLWVTDASGTPRLRRWYTAQEVNCGPGQSSRCDVNVDLYLQRGNGVWYIQTWSPSGYGPWSPGHPFIAQRTATPQRTRLLLPFATNQAGFDTGISVANTGRDSSGVVGRAGTCTLHYFGRLANNSPAVKTETTNAPVPAGESFTLTLSTGGLYGLQGYPGFQGYIEFVCEFPFAHGFGFITDGPIGTADIGSTVPMLVLPTIRNTSYMEAAGQ